MTSPLSSVTGVVSGIQYQDLVNQIITLESQPATQARNQISTINTKLSAIKSYRDLLNAVKTAATRLRDGSAFDTMTVTNSIAAGSKVLAQGSAAATATAGSYRIEVSNLAQAQKLQSASQTSVSTALGVSGTFTINGSTDITIGAADSLGDIRDRINALNTGSNATHVTATILSVSPTANRLVLTSDTTGAAGITLADTSGTVLQGLGYLTAPTTLNSAAVLVTGLDANFKIDGIAMSRSSNTVTDAIAGVTLTLTGAETGAVTSIAIEHSLDSAKSLVQGFVDAYNKLTDFLKTQSTPPAEGGTKPPLYGDPLTRVARGSLAGLLLTSITGTATGLATASDAGLSLDKTGKLSLDGTKFDAAFTGRLADLRQLFALSGSATGSQVTYLAASDSTAQGTYDVNITAAATQASLTGSGFSGTYADDATADTMQVTDVISGKVASISLSNGMTTAQIVSALQAAFTAQGMSLTASASGNDLVIGHPAYGSANGFTVAYTAGGTDGSAQLGFAAGTYKGIDVAGTIGGAPATGSGQVLTANTGSPAAGLTLLYTGTTAPGAAGTTTVTWGTGALLDQRLAGWTVANTGTIAQEETALNNQSTSLDNRATTIESRLERRRATLLAQFNKMEVALAKLQSQSSGLLASLNQTSGG